MLFRSLTTGVHEPELAVVIGRTARAVPASEAMDYVVGFTTMNDVSARDLPQGQHGTARRVQPIPGRDPPRRHLRRHGPALAGPAGHPHAAGRGREPVEHPDGRRLRRGVSVHVPRALADHSARGHALTRAGAGDFEISGHGDIIAGAARESRAE